MELNKYEQYFAETHQNLNEIGLNHWLIGSSLLGPLRDGHFIEGDREVNFGVWADELALIKPRLHEKYRVVLAENVSRVSGIYLLDKKAKSDALGDHPGPFTWLAPHYVSGDKVVQCVGRSHILFWEKDELLPIGHYQHIGEVFCVPCQSEKWLETYYGPEWKVRDANWHWLNNSHNHINLEELGIC
jgi:hypothetical protein